MKSKFTSAGHNDIFAAKYTTGGAVAWAKSFGGIGHDSGNDVAIDGSGNVIVVGSFQGNLNIPPNGLLNAGSSDAVLLLKLASADGAPLASRRFGATTESSEAYSVAVDSADNIFVAGDFYGTGDFGGSAPLTATRLRDGFLAKYTPVGAYLCFDAREK